MLSAAIRFLFLLNRKMPQVLWFHVKRSLWKVSKSSWGKQRKVKIKKVNYRSTENQKYLPYLRSSDEGFEFLRAEKYPDFVHQPSSEMPKDLAQDLTWAFNKLESKGYFYRHWVMVQGKHVLTPVSRTLVGSPGMTYRYLGLRIFALPWSFEGDSGELSEIKKACSVIGRLNLHLKATSCKILEKKEADAQTENQTQNTKLAKRTNADSNADEGNTSNLESPQTHLQGVEADKSSTHRLREQSESQMRGNAEREQNKYPRDIVPESRESTELIDTREGSPVVNNRRGSSQGRPSYKRKRQETRAETVEEGTDFNVALINYMDPLNPELSLKPEPYHGLGPLAVSWHVDGNLVPGSTVAVYSYTCEATQGSEKGRDWMVGISKPFDKKTPALAAPLASGDAYYMLADLNDTHRHCVIAGDQPRFASTHRVVDSGHATLDYIQARCHSALENLIQDTESQGKDKGSERMPALKSLGPEALQLAEEVHNEVEFEWLRQFWMQGSRHAAERSFWIKPMEELEHSWELMELMTKLAIEASMDHESSEDAATIITAILPFIEARERERCVCINRYRADVLLSMEHDRLPLYRPTWDDSDPSRPLPFTLSKIIKKLKARLSEIG